MERVGGAIVFHDTDRLRLDLAPGPLSGLVVEEVKPESVAARAGAQVGDMLLRWRRGDASDVLVSPFDLDQLHLEEAPRGAVTLEGRRGREDLSFGLVDGTWGLEARPRLGSQADQVLAEARQAAGGMVPRKNGAWPVAPLLSSLSLKK